LDALAAAAVVSDDDLATLLVSCAADASRLASSILRDPTAAQDAVQQATLAAWAARRKLRHANNPEAWFRTIVANVCRSELRRRARERPVVATAEPSGGAFQEEVARREQVARAIGYLTADEQLVVGLRFGRDMTIARIAAVTGLREGTVKSRLHNSLAHLRAALASDYDGKTHQHG
jgi:RNA polymerase sigma-70 factor (ECF subfamily)